MESGKKAALIFCKVVGEGDTVGVKWLGFTVSGGTVDETFITQRKLERIVLGDGSVIQVSCDA